MQRMRVAILGLADDGVALAQASSAGGAELVAVADHDRSRTDKIAAELGAQGYVDYRSALIETQADLVVAALPPADRMEYLRMAADRGLPVLTPGPPFVRLEEAAECARIFAERGVPFVVARHWQFEPAYAALREIPSWAGRLFSASVNVIGPAGDLKGWRGDAAQAGGGTLLHDAYDAVDALATLFGLPEEVYAVLPDTTEPGEVRAYDTEDAAAVILRFSGKRVATLNCRRIGAERYWRYRLHGTQATAWLTPEAMTIVDAASMQPTTTRVQTANRFAPILRAVTAAVSGGAAPPSPLSAHLAALAVIETAYLSARTGQGESPGRLYRITTGADAPSPTA